jgi:hypothetical protein
MLQWNPRLFAVLMLVLVAAMALGHAGGCRQFGW